MAKSQKKAEAESLGVPVRVDESRTRRYADGVPVRADDVPEQTAGTNKAGQSADDTKKEKS